MTHTRLWPRSRRKLGVRNDGRQHSGDVEDAPRCQGVQRDKRVFKRAAPHWHVGQRQLVLRQRNVATLEQERHEGNGRDTERGLDPRVVVTVPAALVHSSGRCDLLANNVPEALQLGALVLAKLNGGGAPGQHRLRCQLATLARLVGPSLECCSVRHAVVAHDGRDAVDQVRGARVARDVAVQNQTVCGHQKRAADAVQFECRCRARLAKEGCEQQFAGLVQFRAQLQIARPGFQECGDIGHVGHCKHHKARVELGQRQGAVFDVVKVDLVRRPCIAGRGGAFHRDGSATRRRLCGVQRARKLWHIRQRFRHVSTDKEAGVRVHPARWHTGPHQQSHFPTRAVGFLRADHVVQKTIGHAAPIAVRFSARCRTAHACASFCGRW